MKRTSRPGSPGLAPAPHRVPSTDPSLDAAANGPPLRPQFPSGETGTGLVLYRGGGGEMRIHWWLARNDFERAAAGFPLVGRRPVAVVRLRRERAEGGSDLADEVSLGPAVRHGAGERGVQIPMDHCLYHAELGLTNGEGGWLMLARSNGLYNAAGVGIHWGELEPVPTAGHAAINVPGELDPDLRVAAGAPPVSKPGAGAVTDPTLAGGDLPPGPLEFPLASWEGTSRPVSPSGDQGPNRVAGPSAEALDLDPDRPETHHPAPIQGGVTGETPRTGVAIEPLNYGGPLQRVNGLELDAELRILGRASPGRVIDLFGFRYRVGPGGRFKLILPVTDPELLRRALAATPPPELSQPRDD